MITIDKILSIKCAQDTTSSKKNFINRGLNVYKEL